MSHAVQGHPRWTGHGEEFWQNVIHRRRGWQTAPVYLPWGPHELDEKATRDESARSEDFQHATGEEQRTTINSSRKNEATGPKREECSAVDVSGDESKIPRYKEQYCIGTWNVRSMNQGKLDVVKQDIARVNTDILEISELK